MIGSESEVVKTLFVFGTRPEAIKLCPVLLRLRSQPERFDVKVCVTGQHRSMLDQVLAAFGVVPDHDLNLMQPGQTLGQITARTFAALEPVVAAEKPRMVIVQGDTTTTMVGALTAFYQNVDVGHVEAGLRTWDLRQPFPEEMNRVITSRLATLHFAPTARSAQNLRDEGVDPTRVSVTGNSGIDAVLHVRDRLASGELKGGDWSRLDASRKLILVTAHRRESFGEGMERICRALVRLARAAPVQIVYPVHRNPNVRGPVERILAQEPNILLIEPLDYVEFVDLMRRAYILITDSGGVQEEGPSLGKPILVMREKTERPEAVEAGTVLLVGTDEDKIVNEALRLIQDRGAYDQMSHVHNPYGDGTASIQIADRIAEHYGLAGSAAAARSSGATA